MTVQELMERALPVELDVCPGCGTIVDLYPEDCGCEYPPRRRPTEFFLLHGDALKDEDR